jgi:hypothetical protein
MRGPGAWRPAGRMPKGRHDHSLLFFASSVACLYGTRAGNAQENSDCREACAVFARCGRILFGGAGAGAQITELVLACHGTGAERDGGPQPPPARRLRAFQPGPKKNLTGPNGVTLLLSTVFRPRK